MFDDRLQDIIMQEMMSQFGPEIRTDEGSLAYNACAKIAEKLEEVYGDMDQINDNMIPSTQDDSHLIEYGTERGINYRYATAPIVRGVFQQEIENGERFTCNDYTYTATEAIEDAKYNYRLTCDTDGIVANTNLGQLEPEDYVEDYQGGEITEILIAGENDEDIEIYREKVINSFKSTAFGGNRADYRNFVNSISGVGGCKPKRASEDNPLINIYVISNDFNKPSDDLIDKIQTAVDPEENSGEGDGMAPICHHVKIKSVYEANISVLTDITFDTGYSVETSKSKIETVISDYLSELRQSWESRELEDTIIRISQIDSRILSVEGVLDVSNTKLNGESENLILDYTFIPTMGGVDLNV